MTLADNVHRLTSEHMTLVDGRPVKVPALLDRLEEGASPGSDGGRSAGSPLPINVGAVDLMREIRAEALDAHWEMHATEYRGSLRGLLRLWARPGTLQTAEWEAYLEHVTLDWVDRIEALLKPSKPPRRISLPCPACGEKFAGEERKPALHLHCWGDDEAMLPPGEWRAECVACGAGWDAKEQMAWLVRAVTSEGMVGA